MPLPIEVGKKFLDDVLAMIPEDQREAARSKYSAAHDQFAGAVTAEQAALEQQQRDLEAWRTQLRGWAGTKETEFATREAALTTRQPAADPNRVDPAAPPVKPAAPDVDALVNERLGQFGQQVVAANADALRLMQRHQQLYGQEKVFDLNELFAHPRVREIGLEGAYNDLHKDRIAAEAKKATDAHEARIRADERAKVQTEFSANKGMPTMIPGVDDSAMGVLERRSADPDKTQFGVAAAVEEYRRIQQGVPGGV